MHVDKIGSYQVLGKLGSGAHSSISHIRRAADARHYALKEVPINGAGDAKYLEQARHEFTVAGMLDHPHLIKIFALETSRDWLFRIREVRLLIEYVNGKTLDAVIGLTLPMLAQVFARVAAGLGHMHQRRVCHADLKPNNILLSRTGEVKIIDYGLAWIRGEQKERVQGTPEYMAPEQARKAIVTERTDIYNFGAAMYRMVTHQYPPNTVPEPGALRVDADTWARLLKPVRECKPETPPELAKLIDSCLSFDPARRPPMRAVQETLNALVTTMVQSDDDRLESLEW